MNKPYAWLSLHIFRHDELDPLITGHVGPLAARLVDDDLARRFFYLRYWEGGPHVRLRVCARPEDTDRILSVARARLGAHFRAAPSRGRVTPTLYAEWAARYARAEQLTDYDREVVPPDTVTLGRYEPETSSFGGGAALELVENHFCVSSALALRCLASGRPVLSTASVATLATYVCLPDRATSVLPGDDDPAWPAAGAEFLELAARLRAADTDQPGGDPAVGWLFEMRRLGARMTELGRPGPRVLSRCLHLHLNRLGVTATQERRLRRLARRAAAGTPAGP